MCLRCTCSAPPKKFSAIKSVLPQLKGVTIIFYHFMPRCTHRTQLAGSAQAYADAGDTSEESGTDVDQDMHDFTADGVLPEALTSMHSVKTASQKAAHLASDWGEIDAELGLSCIQTRYPKRITFLHKADAQGDKTTTCAMVLVPVDEDEDDGFSIEKLRESTMFSSGAYTEVPIATSWVVASKKEATLAKRALTESWQIEEKTSVDVSQKFATSKISRGQVGKACHETWLKDLAATCEKKGNVCS